MSSLNGFRSRLILQAVITAVFAMAGSTASSAWTIPTLVVAAGAVFVGLAMRAEPDWRWYVVGFESLAIGYGLIALVSGHYVPGTIVAGWTLYYLLSQAGASAFAGTPTWAPPAPAPAQPFGAPAYPPPAPVYGAPAQAAYPPPAPLPAAPLVPAAAQLPTQPLASRAAAMTILPGK